MIHFIRLFGSDGAAFRGMTFAGAAAELSALSPDSHMLAIGVVEDERPVGLATAYGKPGEVGEITSIFVRPEEWNRGIGTQLVALMEAALRERGCPFARLSFTTQGQSAAAVERLLQKRDWSTPVTKMIHATIAPEISEHAGWIQELTIPAPYSVFTWTELSDAERADLEAVRHTITPALWPFHEDDGPIEPLCSLGLRLEKEVVGWLICHRLAPDVLRYTSLYVREEWRSAALSFGLLAEGVRRKGKFLGPAIQGTLAVQVENAPMLRVLHRKLKPYARSWGELRAAGKTLV